MFLKTIATIILAPIILISEFFGLFKAEVYIAPPNKTQVVIEEGTSTEAIVTKASTTPEKNTPIKNASTTPVKKQPVVKKVETKTVEPSAVKPFIITPVKQIDFETVNTNSRKTIVNILCTTKYNDLSPISGTGVIVSGSGLILTNAHIAQYFLLKDFREKDYLKCVGRTGSPAYPKYNLELVYISPNWVANNKAILKEQDPKGTGENDFAFLRITGPIDNSQTLDYYTYIQPNTREIIEIGEPVLLVSYPAGFLGGLSVLQDLNITSAITNIQDVFTFKNDSIDVLSVGGTVVSQKGSSGGLVVDGDTSLIGIISTSSDGQTTSSRGLNAITISYINRSMQAEININLKQFLNLNHQIFAKTFADTTAKTLTKIITDELTKSN